MQGGEATTSLYRMIRRSKRRVGTKTSGKTCSRAGILGSDTSIDCVPAASYYRQTERTSCLDGLGLEFASEDPSISASRIEHR